MIIFVVVVSPIQHRGIDQYDIIASTNHVFWCGRLKSNQSNIKSESREGNKTENKVSKLNLLIQNQVQIIRLETTWQVILIAFM